MKRNSMPTFAQHCARQSHVPQRTTKSKCLLSLRRNNARRKHRGATLVEFALVIPIILAMLLGIAETGAQFSKATEQAKRQIEASAKDRTSWKALVPLLVASLLGALLAVGFLRLTGMMQGATISETERNAIRNGRAIQMVWTKLSAAEQERIQQLLQQVNPPIQ